MPELRIFTCQENTNASANWQLMAQGVIVLNVD
jgi:hypothetical protein